MAKVRSMSVLFNIAIHVVCLDIFKALVFHRKGIVWELMMGEMNLL